MDYKKFLEALTKNDVTLDSEGVGRATDYLHLRKHRVGHAWSHRSGHWNHLDSISHQVHFFFVNFACPPQYGAQPSRILRTALLLGAAEPEKKIEAKTKKTVS